MHQYAINKHGSRDTKSSAVIAPSFLPGVRAKLNIGAVDDPAEREADRVADTIMRSVLPTAQSGLRPGEPSQCRSCGGDWHDRSFEPPLIRRAPVSAAGAAPAAAAATAVGRLGSGVALASSERSFFEPRFGRDLSHVRIHSGPTASAASRALAARAFTLGKDVAFAEGEYRPGTVAGRHLIAHELVHVMQGNGSVIRAKCQDKPPACDPEKQKEAEARTAGVKGYTGFVYRAATAKCYRPTDIAASIKEEDSSLFAGRLAVYITDAVDRLNPTDPTKIHAGDCFAFPKGWTDPNIGKVDDELAVLNDPLKPAEKNRVIATIYAEQTDASAALDAHRKYIFYAMLLRIQGAEWGPSFQKVVEPGAFHASDPHSDTYAPNFVPAKAYLEGKKADPKTPVNADAIDRLKATVEATKAKDIPTDAGPYYFHWSLGGNGTVTAETTYQAALKKGEAKDAAEKKGALEQARKALGVPTAATLKKTIRGTTPAPNERLGSMYIFG